MNRLIFILLGFLILFLGAAFFLKPSTNQAVHTPKEPTVSSPPHQIVSQQLPFPLNVTNGYQVSLFASDVSGARDEQFTPGGTLLVSSPSTGSVFALPDKDNDGIADRAQTVLSGLNHPHGLAFYRGKLFIAEVDRVARYIWDETSKRATLDKILFSLPENGDHNNRTLAFDDKGNLYVSVGSTCNICHESDQRDATVMISNADGDNPRIFATGLRNAAFLAINLSSGALWVTEMGRDYLGDNAPPDEINIVKQGNNYGWPYCYGNQMLDQSFGGQSQAYCQKTAAPIYAIPAHSAPLGLAFIPSSFSQHEQGNLLVAYHGSWNRSIPTGYKVVMMHVSGDTITGVSDFLTGFLQDSGTVLGRPVDLVFDTKGRLFISDDKTGNIYLVTPK